MNNEKIIVLDFGGQYNQLIARRVRELNVFAEVKPYTISIEDIKQINPKGIIFTGGPNSVYDPKSPTYTSQIFELGIPILGICYGSQLIAHKLGGQVKTALVSEYGSTDIFIDNPGMLMADIGDIADGNANEKLSSTNVWMSHTDYIASLPEGFVVTSHSKDCPVASMENSQRNIYATQFHPEVLHTKEGQKILSNFVHNVCGCKGDWQIDSFADETIRLIRQKVGNGRALLGLSGGVDSSVAAVLMSKAIGSQLTCVFVDHGLLRKNEAQQVEQVFGNSGNFDLNFVRVDASNQFYAKLKGVTEPEKKRKIIGEEFIRVFEQQTKIIGQVDYLVQGTIYPDVIESGLGDSAVIKSHHNVGGLPDVVDFKEIIEPLRMLFKDEVRKIGIELGLPSELVNRQPFPGPGLGIRIVGEVTPEKIKIVQEADAIYQEELHKAKVDENLGQYFAGLTNMQSVGVMGDFRTYDYAVALRAVNTSDFMTASASQIPYNVLFKVTSRIINEVPGVNRVMYDLTSKPPGTIEFE